MTKKRIFRQYVDGMGEAQRELENVINAATISRERHRVLFADPSSSTPGSIPGARHWRC